MAESVIVASIMAFFVFAALTRKYNFGSRQETIRLFSDVFLPERECRPLAWTPHVAKHPHRVVSKWPIVKPR